MKKLLLSTLAVTLVSAGAFAQGKIGFATDVNHLVYFTTDTTKLNTGDSGMAGKGLYTTTIGSLAGTPSIVADLYAGTSAGSLIKVTSGVLWTPAEGQWISKNVILPSSPTAFPATTLTYFEVNIHDARDADAASAWLQQGHYGGVSAEFTAFPGPSTYPSMASVAASQSTWLPGTFQIPDMAAGNFGAIQVYATVPEPGTFALAGLGAAALMIFRRRK